MALNLKNVQSKVAKAVQVSADMNEAKAGGASVPEEGLAMLRFIGWIELGQHEKTFKGQKKLQWMAEAIFELHGKKYPVQEYEGKKYAPRITVKLNVPAPGDKPSAKSTYYKLFKAMNYDGKAKTMPELLGNGYLGNVFHREYEQDGEKRKVAQFNDPKIEESPLTIRAPRVQVMNDEGEPEDKPVKVPDQVNEFRLFLWATPDAEQWASIHIPGTYEGGKSKNVWQNKIKASLSYEGSEIEALLLGDPDIEADEVPTEDSPAEAPEKPAKAEKPKGSTKGSGKKADAATAPETASKSKSKKVDTPATKVDDNPLDELESLDDDIPF